MSQSPISTATAIAAGTAMGAVSLTVSDIGRSRAFYETALGLSPREREDGGLAFGVAGGTDLVTLHGDVSAPDWTGARPGSTTWRSCSDRALTSRTRWPGWRRHAGRWTASPTISSPRRCTCPTLTATASSSIATVRATSGATPAASFRWRRCRWTYAGSPTN